LLFAHAKPFRSPRYRTPKRVKFVKSFKGGGYFVEFTAKKPLDRFAPNFTEMLSICWRGAFCYSHVHSAIVDLATAPQKG